jgi:hypothetical protein
MGLLNIFVNTNSRPISRGNSFPNSAQQHDLGKLRITPWKMLWGSFLNRIIRSRITIPHSELRAVSKDANTKCLNCGWKYNFQRTESCPICHSEKAYLLARGTFLYDFLTISVVAIAMFSLVLLAYKYVINQ